MALQFMEFSFRLDRNPSPREAVGCWQGRGVSGIGMVQGGGMTMDRILLTGGAMVAVGIVLAAAFIFVARYGATFEMLEDTVVRWLGKA
jgi:hypothetical protein